MHASQLADDVCDPKYILAAKTRCGGEEKNTPFLTADLSLFRKQRTIDCKLRNAKPLQAEQDTHVYPTISC